MAVNTKGTGKRQRFFALGVRAAQRTLGYDEVEYPCPICEKRFTQDAIAADLLTLEHVPPESLGGRELLLTCKKCNSDAGSYLDSAVAVRRDLHGLALALAGRDARFTGHAKLRMGGETINVDLTVAGGGAFIRFLRPHNDPKRVERVTGHLEAHVGTPELQGPEFTLTPMSRYNVHLSHIGDLRTAYLASVAKFGFRYGFSHRVRQVRQQIREPAVRLLDGFVIAIPSAGSDERRMGFMTQPVPCLFVQVGPFGTMLPPLADEGDFYATLPASMGGQGKVQLSVDVFDWPRKPEFLLDFV